MSNKITTTTVVVVNAHTGEEKKLQRQQTISVFKDEIAKSFSSKSNKIKAQDIKITTVDDIEVSNDSDPLFAEQETFLFYTKDDSAALKASLNLQMEIIPHVNILIHGGDEYDFFTALAEIVDNSIQNTKYNDGERIIEITMERDEDRNQVLHIWDNGRGMNMQGLTKWATLGISAPPPPEANTATSEGKEKSERSTRSHASVQSSKEIERYLTNDFSRYGVGSKKAIFNIGDDVTMCSKMKDSRWVYEVTLSRSKLEEDFNNASPWKANFLMRPPTERERKWPSFTSVKIGEIKELYKANYDSKKVCQALCHMYHYYIFGPRGNCISNPEANGEEEVPKATASKAKKKDRKKSTDEDEDAFAEDVSSFKSYITFKVDGKTIDRNSGAESDDMESIYLQNGKNPLNFEFRVEARVKNFAQATQDPSLASQSDGSAQSNCKVSSLVKGTLFYYPFKDGRETLPIPTSVRKEDSGAIEEDNIPLSDRDPGFEVFWNGRLLSNERIKSLAFMKAERSDEVPDHCYRRVKGMLFLDASFEVSQNKMYLCRQTPLCQSLLDYSDRKLAMQFKKWIHECHSKYDEEIIFEIRDTKSDVQGDKLLYQQVRLGKQVFKKGDNVLMKKRPKVIGQILEIYRELSSEAYGCFVKVKEWNVSDEDKEDIYQISRIAKVLNEKEFKEETDKLKTRLPAYVDIVDSDNVPPQQKRPPSTHVEAGYVLNYITVAIMSGEHKIVNKPSIGMSMKVTHVDSKQTWDLHADKPYSAGKYGFIITKLEPSGTFKFTQEGLYRFEFKSDLPNVKPRIYMLRVVAGPAKTIKAAFKHDHDVNEAEDDDSLVPIQIGSCFPPIIVTQYDEYGNKVRAATTDSNNNTSQPNPQDFKIRCLTSSFQLSSSSGDTPFKVSKWSPASDNPPAEEATEDGDSNNLAISAFMIEDLFLIEGQIMDGNEEEPCEIEIEYGTNLAPARLKFVALPGDPDSIQFTEETAELLKNYKGRNHRALPSLTLAIFDQWKNRIISFPRSKVPAPSQLTPTQKRTTRNSRSRSKKSEPEQQYICLVENQFLDGSPVEIAQNSDGYFETKDALRLSIFASPTPPPSTKGKKDLDYTLTPLVFSVKDFPDCNMSHDIAIQQVQTPAFRVQIIPHAGQASFVVSADDRECRVNAAVGEELVNWMVHIVGEHREILKFDGICSVSWVDDSEIPIKHGKCLLPTLSLPQVARTVPYIIEIKPLDGDDDVKTTYKLSIQTHKGPPVKFMNLSKKLRKLACFSEFSLTFAVVDLFNNQLNIAEDLSRYPQLANIKPKLSAVVASSEDDGERPKIEFINQEEWVLNKTDKGAFEYSKVAVAGPVGDIILSIKDAAGVVKGEEKIKLKLVEGPPSCIKVNNFQEYALTIKNFGTLPTLEVSLHDDYGNIVNTDGVCFEVLQPQNIQLCPNEENANRIEIASKEGIFIIPPMFVRAEEFGEQIISICAKEEACIFQSAKLKLNIEQGSHPTKLQLYVNDKLFNEATATYEAGQFSFEDVQVRIIGENGSPTRVPSCPLSVDITDPAFETISFVANGPPSQGELSYMFSNINYACTKAGKYKLTFSLDCSALPYSCMLNNDERLLTEVRELDVHPAVAKTLELSTEFNLPVIDATEKRTLWEDLTVQVVDEYGNTTESYGQGSVKISLVCPIDDNNIEVPILEGTLERRIVKGRARFSKVSVKEGVGSSGIYKLRFSSEGLTPMELDLSFCNDAVTRARQNELQEQKKKLQSEIDEREEKIREANKEHEANQNKLTTLNQQLSDLQKEMAELGVTNIEWSTMNLDKIAKLMENLNKRMLHMKKKETSTRRKAFYGHDKAIEEMLEAKHREGVEASGVVGVIAEIGKVEDEKLDKILSNFAKTAMRIVVVKDSKAAAKWRDRFKNYEPKVAMLPLDNVYKYPSVNPATATLNLRLEPDDNAKDNSLPKGYIGHAANLIEIVGGDVEMRHVFYALFGEAMVFDTYDNAVKYRQSVIARSRRCPLILTLDGERVESSGVIYAGVEKSEVSYRFGQMPLTEGADFKRIQLMKNKLEEIIALMKSKEQFEQGKYAESEKRQQQVRAEHTPRLQQLHKQLDQINEEIREMNNQMVGGGGSNGNGNNNNNNNNNNRANNKSSKNNAQRQKKSAPPPPPPPQELSQEILVGDDSGQNNNSSNNTHNNHNDDEDDDPDGLFSTPPPPRKQTTTTSAAATTTSSSNNKKRKAESNRSTNNGSSKTKDTADDDLELVSMSQSVPEKRTARKRSRLLNALQEE